MALSVIELLAKFPDEESATKWLEAKRWSEGRYCPHCGSMDAVQDVPCCKPMPYRCGDCHKYFSMRTGTVMAKSNLPIRTWLIAGHLMVGTRRVFPASSLPRILGSLRSQPSS